MGTLAQLCGNARFAQVSLMALNHSGSIVLGSALMSPLAVFRGALSFLLALNVTSLSQQDTGEKSNVVVCCVPGGYRVKHNGVSITQRIRGALSSLFVLNATSPSWRYTGRKSNVVACCVLGDNKVKHSGASITRHTKGKLCTQRAISESMCPIIHPLFTGMSSSID